MAAQIAFKNFDSSTAGDSAASVGFINVSGTWQVTTTGEISSPNAFAPTATTQALQANWNGLNPNDQCHRFQSFIAWRFLTRLITVSKMSSYVLTAPAQNTFISLTTQDRAPVCGGGLSAVCLPLSGQLARRVF